jgi:twitching motility protein PilT
MPYIDLNSSTNANAGVTLGNDLSGLPQAFTQTSLTDASLADDSSPPVIGNIQQPQVQQSQKVSTSTVKMQNNILPVNEEHILMRNIPTDFATHPTRQEDGIKEFTGPSLPSNPAVNSKPAVETQELRRMQPKQEIPAVKQVTPIVELDIQPQINMVKPSPVQVHTPVIQVNDGLGQIDGYLQLVIDKNASDLHIAVGFPPTIRIDGKLIGLSDRDMTAFEVQKLLMPLLSKRLSDEMTKNYDVDFSYNHKSGNRFRVNIFLSKGAMAAAFRFIPSKIRSIAELGLPKICYDLIKQPHGLLLLTGPTGSGKSTSIAAMIQEINVNEAKHIVTIEDPVEYLFPREKSIINQREIGSDTSGWDRALRELLRQDPNIVLVGEMRDYETIASTITVAETGHLVFATLHTNSASQTIDRIIDVFPDVQQPQIRAQLASVINAVVSQRLIPLINGGRVAVFEVMVANPAIKNAIREGKTYQIDNIIQTNADQGMITLEKSLVQLIRNGQITLDVARDFTSKPDELDSLLGSN